MPSDPTTITSPNKPRGNARSKPLTSKELLSHPAFKSNEWNLQPTTSGYCTVAQTRSGEPFKLFYEIHGTGPIHIVWIMGLGAFRTAWKRQSKYFGHETDRATKYSCLVFDNRGVGKSDKPTCRYSSLEMARDVVDLLRHVGWLDDSSGSNSRRNINVAGVSMGGMIAQELALLIPEHIQSLILISTAPRLVRTVPFLENLRQRINMFIPRDIDTQLDDISHRLFSSAFLEEKDDEFAGDESKTFPTRQDRFAASELAKRQDLEGFTKKGFILQAIAAGWHHKSDEELKRIVEEVGADRVLVMHGTEDQMITWPHFNLFKKGLGEGGVEYSEWNGVGHVISWEKEDEFNKKVEHFMEKTGKLN